MLGKNSLHCNWCKGIGRVCEHLSSLIPTLLSSLIPTLVEGSHEIIICIIKIIPSFASSTKLPRGSDERSTELWDMFELSFSYLYIFVNNLIFIIYMSSQTVYLSVVAPSTVACGLRSNTFTSPSLD